MKRRSTLERDAQFAELRVVFEREVAARNPQPPLTKAERELMQARLCQWEADFDFIGQYNAGFLAYCRALYGLRHPIGELPPTPAHNTPEEDIAMMGATTLGTASPVGDGSDLLMVGK